MRIWFAVGDARPNSQLFIEDTMFELDYANNWNRSYKSLEQWKNTYTGGNWTFYLIILDEIPSRLEVPQIFYEHYPELAL